MLGVALLGVPRAGATTVTAMDVETMAALSSCIVEGHVVDVSSSWNATHDQILTTVTLDVTLVHAGACGTGRRTLTVLGGEADGLMMKVHGAPHFAKDESVVLFLAEGADLFVPVVGLDRGKLTVRMEEKTGAEVIGNEALGYLSREELTARMAAGRRQLEGEE